MKTIFHILSKSILVGAFITILCFNAWAIDDAIIAVVNNELITLKDLRSYIHSNYIALVAEGVKGDELKKVMSELEKNGINKLIEDKLMLSRSEKLGLSVREKLVDDRFTEIKAKYPSEQVFLDALIKGGGTITDLKDKIRTQLKLQYIVEYEVKSKIYINPQEVTNYYNQHTDDFKKKEKANLDSIYIPFDNDKTAAKQKADEALKLIQDGKDFIEVAQQYSKSPALGIVERGQLLPTIEQSVFNLNENEVSPVMEVDTGFYILKLRELIPAQTASLQETKKYIYDFLYKQKFRERLSTWIDKLKKEAYVEIKQ